MLDFEQVRCENQNMVVSDLEAQQRYFSYRAILVAIVSQKSFVLVFMGYRTIIACVRCKMGYRTDVPV